MSMMQGGGWTFDARTVTPQTNLEPLPEGWYKVVITKSNIKPTRNEPNNSMMAFELKVIEGQFNGRTAYHNLNLWHSNPQTVEIAYRQMSALCYVTGQFQIAAQQAADNVLPMMHNIPFYVHLVVTPGNTGPMNNVRGLKDMNGNEPGKTGGGAMPGQAQQPAPQVGAPGGSGWSSGAPQGQPQQPSQMGAPGGWQGQPGPGQMPPGQQQPYAGPQAQPGQPQAWTPPAGQPGPGAMPQGQPGAPQWGAPQQQPPQGGPAPTWGGPGGAPQGGPPQGQAWTPPQGQPGAPQGGQPQYQQPGPGPQPGAPQGQQWQPPGGQPAGGPQGAWGPPASGQPGGTGPWGR